MFNSRMPAEPNFTSSKSTVRRTLLTLLKVGVIFFALFMFIASMMEVLAGLIPISWEKSVATPIVASIGQLKSSHPNEEKLQHLIDELIALDPSFPYAKIDINMLKLEAENAFAYLGAKIGVTKKLLERVSSENELVFILAHELGHHYHRHPIKSLGSVVLWNLLLASAGFSSMSDGNLATLAMNSYSRAHEVESDLYAVKLIYKRYGHLAGIFDFFKRHQTHEHWTDQWISSHPLSTKRIEKLKQFAIEKQWPLEGELHYWHTEEQTKE